MSASCSCLSYLHTRTHVSSSSSSRSFSSFSGVALLPNKGARGDRARALGGWFHSGAPFWFSSSSSLVGSHGRSPLTLTVGVGRLRAAVSSSVPDSHMDAVSKKNDNLPGSSLSAKSASSVVDFELVHYWLAHSSD